MARHRVTGEAAFAVLVRASQRSNTKLLVVCQQPIDTGELAP